jgi:hypothetical protein
MIITNIIPAIMTIWMTYKRKHLDSRSWLHWELKCLVCYVVRANSNKINPLGKLSFTFRWMCG